MKKYIVLLLFFTVLLSCEEENTNVFPEIKVGTGEKSLTEISINKFTERKIILSGGNKKYIVNIEDSRIAKASVYRDTLKIKALLEGSTFASIKSHNYEVTLDVNVVPQQINVSQKSIVLAPKDISKFVSVSGGGDIVTIEKIDSENILDAKWNGETGILEIKAHYEGEAIIRFKSNNVVTKEVNVKIKSQGEVKDIGIYSTTHKNVYIRLKPIMIVKRKNVGTWLSVSTNPYGIVGVLNKKIVAMFSPIKNPQKGSYINVNVSFSPFTQSVANINTGINKMFVDDVNKENNTVVLRGRGFKVVLPIDE